MLAVGKGSAFVIGGYCYHPGARTRMLEVEVDGSRQKVERFRLPRQDVYARVGANGGSGANAFRSGFVAMPALAPVDSPREVEVRLVLTLAGDREESVPVGRLRLEPSSHAPRDHRSGIPGRSGPAGRDLHGDLQPSGRPPSPTARLDPQADPQQLDLPDQRRPLGAERPRATRKRDRGGPSLRARSPMTATSASTATSSARSQWRRPPRDFVTLCDQDDRWRPEKLERLLEEIGGAQLVYSDARVVSPDGELIHGSYWSERRNNYKNFGSLLLANSVTGAASLFRRELLDDVLPFPPALAQPFHDHWLAVVALARGEIAYIDEPLYDYVQRAGAVIGHATANRRPKPIRRHLIERLRNPGDGSRIAYYYNWYQQLLFAEVLRLRCWGRMEPAKRRTLRRLLSADDGVAGLAWLLGRRARRLLGHDETLDRELLYAYALLRRRAVSLYTLGRRRPGRWLPRDASIPPMPTREDSP